MVLTLSYLYYRRLWCLGCSPPTPTLSTMLAIVLHAQTVMMHTWWGELFLASIEVQQFNSTIGCISVASLENIQMYITQVHRRLVQWFDQFLFCVVGRTFRGTLSRSTMASSEQRRLFHFVPLVLLLSTASAQLWLLPARSTSWSRVCLSSLAGMSSC